MQLDFEVRIFTLLSREREASKWDTKNIANISALVNILKGESDMAVEEGEMAGEEKKYRRGLRGYSDFT
jgi:hypothetical protein